MTAIEEAIEKALGMAPIAQESSVQPFTPPETSNQVGVVLDALQQEFADLCSGERACQWAKGDLAAKALAACGSKAERKVVLGALASLGHCTAGYVRQLSLVAAAFSHEQRKPDVAWSLYRACLQAADRKKTPWDATSILEIALGNGWHCKDVNALGRADKEPTSSLKATCGDCGAKVSVSVAGMGGVEVPCPVCIGVRYEENHERPMIALGTLS